MGDVVLKNENFRLYTKTFQRSFVVEARTLFGEACNSLSCERENTRICDRLPRRRELAKEEKNGAKVYTPHFFGGGISTYHAPKHQHTALMEQSSF
jgi:hypothetical protein